jgi:cyclohexadieny/prephenate dehydrogenase
VRGRFQEDLFSLQRAIRWGEGDKLFDLFSRTRDIRRGIIQMGQDAPDADFGRHKKP